MLIETLLLSFITFHFATSIDPCQTPNGQNGDCKPINECPSIFSLFQGKRTDAVNKFLLDSRCSTSVYPKVCCPIGSSLPPPLPDKSECGLTVEPKIHGGNATGLDEFPWLALLEYKSKSGKTKFLCGGALISKRYVLTARHCLRSSLFSVRLGEYNTTSNPDCIQEKYGTDCAPEVLDVPVENTVSYVDKTSAWNDIALIRLSREVDFTDFVRPVCLPMAPEDASETYLGKKVVIAGWGATENSNSSEVKLKAVISVQNLSVCAQNTFSSRLDLHDRQICAGGAEGVDSCKGDSGGPLMYNKNREWYAVGIVSFGAGDGCGQMGRPSVYVHVAKYSRWIRENVKP